MPEHRPRSRLAALLAASLVSLFVVMVSAPSHAVGVRAGSVVSGSSAQQAGPVDDHAAADDHSVTLDLAGLAPASAALSSQLVRLLTDGVAAGVRLVERAHQTDRGPPAR